VGVTGLQEDNVRGVDDMKAYPDPVDDPRVVYTVHQYEPFVYTHQDPPDLTNTYPSTSSSPRTPCRWR